MSEKITVSYQGVKGSYSYQASSEFFPEANYRGHRSFYSAIQAVHQGRADYAMIPVENSTAGRVMEVYNLLPESGLHIVGEYLLPISHRLMIPFKSFRGAPPRGTMTTEEIIAWKKSPLSEEEKKNCARWHQRG